MNFWLPALFDKGMQCPSLTVDQDSVSDAAAVILVKVSHFVQTHLGIVFTLQDWDFRLGSLRETARHSEVHIYISNGEALMSKSIDEMIVNTAGERNRETDLQSGDTQGLSKSELVSNQSVEELAAEGQAFEAEAVSGVEDASSEVHEVTTKQVAEDDVPLEYLEEK